MRKGAVANETSDLQPMSRTEIGLWLAAFVGVIALVEVLGKAVIGLSLILLLVALCLLSVWAIGWAFVKLFLWLFGEGGPEFRSHGAAVSRKQ